MPLLLGARDSARNRAPRPQNGSTPAAQAVASAQLDLRQDLPKACFEIIFFTFLSLKVPEEASQLYLRGLASSRFSSCCCCGGLTSSFRSCARTTVDAPNIRVIAPVLTHPSSFIMFPPQKSFSSLAQTLLVQIQENRTYSLTNRGSKFWLAKWTQIRCGEKRILT